MADSSANDSATQPKRGKPGHNAPNGRNQDWFEFQQYVPSLAEMLWLAPAPFTLGVFGPWGSGKTGMMKILREELKTPKKGDPRNVLTIWFDAWKYGREESIWRGLLVHTFAELQAHLSAQLESESLDDAQKEKLGEALRKLDELSQSLYRTVTVTTPGNLSIDWGQAGKAGVKLALPLANQFIPGAELIGKLGELIGFGGDKDAAPAETKPDDKKKADTKLDSKAVDELLKAFRREEHTRYVEQVRFLDQFHERFAAAVQLATESGAVEKLVFFIDDLDRCLPEKAVEVLESIKLFLGNQHCLFVVGVDEEVIHRGIAHRYGDMFKDSGVQQRRFREEYLEKIVQLAFPLPPIHRDLLNGYVGAHLTTLEKKPEENGWVQELFAEGLPRNPRKLLRACELFNLLWRVGEARGLEIYPDILARLVAIQLRDSGLSRAVAHRSGILAAVERFHVQQAWEKADARLGREQKVAESGEGDEVEPIEKREVKPDRLIERFVGDDYDWLAELLLYRVGERPTIANIEGYELMRHIELISFDSKQDAPSEAVGIDDAVDIRAATVVAESARASESVRVLKTSKKLLERLLCGELSEIESAVNELHKDEYRDYRVVLFEMFNAESTSTAQRISAGNALAFVGDPRFHDERVWARDDYWVSIPAGDFWCGSADGDELAEDDEKPQHIVSLSAFKIARWPVTNIEYARFVQAEKIEPPNHWDGRDNPPRGQANHPVVHVSWNDAQAYVDWLNRHPGGGNIMLPSEAQWERAARGPQLWQGKENRRRWPWGDAADAIGEYANAEMNVSRTTPVGCYPRGASPEGIFDLAGNIFEWCRDSPREYRAAGERDPEGPLDGLRVLRGGGWLDGGRYLRAATRGALEPGKRFYLVGFRLAGG